jgi:predicted ATPase/class 3 adenylate cyclase
MMPARPTGTVTFLFTDMAGSTRLWDLHPLEMATAQVAHDRRLRRAVEDHGGYVFSSAGDGIGAAFGTPGAALSAALDAQTGMAGIEAGGEPIRVRMGIHTGIAEERDGDYFGTAVNRAARIMAVAHGGQVVVSGASAELLGAATPAGVVLRDLGAHRLRDLSEPEHLLQVEYPGLEESFPPLRTVDAYPNNLPVQLTSFIGREDDLAAVIRQGTERRLVTLIGVGGCGKTRLAIQAAAEMLHVFPHGVWLVDFAPLKDPELVVRSIAHPLGLADRPDRRLLEDLVAHLRERRSLILLDNCEHLVQHIADVTARLLADTPDLHILATSREMLGVPGEFPFQVRSLATPPPHGNGDGDPMAYEATRLFVDRAEMARPGFRPESADATAVAQICRRLDGIPLAIELAAARLRVLSPEQIAARLDDAFRLLTGGARTALPRQQTLQAAIDWSHDLLSLREKVLFRRLSAFAGGFDLAAAEAVCGFDPLTTGDILDGLAALEAKSLLQAETGPDEVRYRQLETLRQYAGAKLSESGESDAVRRRHAEHFALLAARAEQEARGPGELALIRRLDDATDNIRAALGWALDGGDVDLGARMAGSLYRYWIVSDWTEEGLRWLERGLRAHTRGDRTRAMALLGAGSLASQVGRFDRAGVLLDQAIDLAERLGASDLLSAAYNNRGNVAAVEGDHAGALAYFREGLERERRRGEVRGQIIALQNVAWILGEEDSNQALDLARQAVELARGAGSEYLVAESVAALAWQLRSRGDLDEAEALVPEVRGIEKRAGYSPGRADHLAARITLDRGLPEMAAPLLATAIASFRSQPGHDKMVLPAVDLIVSWAQLSMHLGEHEAAARLLGAVDAILHRHSAEIPERRHDRTGIRNAISATLGAERVERLAGEGARWSLTEALEEVSRLGRPWLGR